MIPKVIHYCWFGGNPLPESVKECIDSWRKYCPDYKIIQWNEDNYDVTQNAYMYEAYKQKRYGFVPDFARLDIIYNYGGFYLDTDVELIKSLEDLRKYKCFMGMETVGRVNGGIGFGAERGQLFMKMNRDQYLDREFTDTITSVDITTKLARSMGLKRKNILQELENVTILPTDVLCPMNMATRKIKLTKNTVSIHKYDASWKLGADKYLLLKLYGRRLLGDDIYDLVKRIKKKNS